MVRRWGGGTLPVSLSARRAWIEIELIELQDVVHEVALREESVDRNKRNRIQNELEVTVALREESVDRNFLLLRLMQQRPGRSPRGERG